MANVIFSAGIDSVSGALAKPSKSGSHSCNKMLLATHRTAPTTNNQCNRLFLRKKVTRDPNSFSAHELELQQRLTTASRATHARMSNLSTIEADTAAFKAQKDQPGGKKTFYQYIFNLEYDKLRS
jgi:hypothetical protein